MIHELSLQSYLDSDEILRRRQKERLTVDVVCHVDGDGRDRTDHLRPAADPALTADLRVSALLPV